MLVLLLLLSQIVNAVEFVVSNPTELTSAIQASDTAIDIIVNPGTYILDRYYIGNKHLSITAVNAIFICSSTDNIFAVGNSTFSVDGVHFKNCQNGAGVAYSNYATVSFTNCLFSDNTGVGTASVFHSDNSVVLFSNCAFWNNSADASGSVILSGTTSLTIAHSSFDSNSGPNGVVSWISNADSTFEISFCNASNNHGSQGAGFLLVSGTPGTVTVTNSRFVNNTSDYLYCGAAMQLLNQYEVSIHNSSFFGNICKNKTVSYGGAILFFMQESNDLTIKSSKFYYNEAVYGGAIAVSSLAEMTSILLEDVILEKNYANYSGSALFFDLRNASVNMDHVTIKDNIGGVMFYAEGVDAQLESTIITQNTNGMQCVNSTFNLQKSSIYNNSMQRDFVGCDLCMFSGQISGDPCLDGCPRRDVCMVCRGNGTTCLGCDMVPYSEVVVDQCQVCGGNGTCSITTTTVTTSSITSTSSVGTTTGTTMGTSLGTTGTSTGTTGGDSQKALQSSSSKPTGIIAVAVVIPIVFVLGIIGIVMLILWRRKRSKKDPESRIELQNRESVLFEGVKKVKNVVVQDRLGGGQFSDVYKGLWMGTTVVALKQLKKQEQFEEFMKEAALLVSLSHRNVLQFYGIYTSADNIQYIVTEYLNKGSLRDLLITEKMDQHTLLSICLDIVSGMAYIADSKIVHADLAARNVLIADDNGRCKYLAKIGDLGLGKFIREDANYYTGNNKTVAIKWAAPEVIEYGKYSEQSDVWSFGVVMWEIFSGGKAPYSALTNQETLEHVVQGYRLPNPTNCPENIYNLMKSCWELEVADRPRFADLYTKLLPLLKEEPQVIRKSVNLKPVYETLYSQ